VRAYLRWALASRRVLARRSVRLGCFPAATARWPLPRPFSCLGWPQRAQRDRGGLQAGRGLPGCRIRCRCAWREP